MNLRSSLILAAATLARASTLPPTAAASPAAGSYPAAAAAAIPSTASAVLGNWSLAFGHLFSGSSDTPNCLSSICSDFSTLGHGRLSPIGLNPDLVKQPICNASASSANTADSLPWTIRSLSDMFIAQLLGAFSDGTTVAGASLSASPKAKKAYSYICTNARYSVLDAYHLDSARVVNTTCHAAGTNMAPRPAQALASANLTDVSLYSNAVSDLFGSTWTATARDKAELGDLCTTAKGRLDGYARMGMSADLVKECVCGGNVSEMPSAVPSAHPHGPPMGAPMGAGGAPMAGMNAPLGSAPGAPMENAPHHPPFYFPGMDTLPKRGEVLTTTQATQLIKMHMTRIFVIVLNGMSDMPDWNDFLCKNLSVRGLDSCGLMGEGVLKAVCAK
ncbi:hypothetical protein K470DRAFT_265739 [Piedraia hortae CBS 480.64]|uniref:Uncharacterized protein n=1 Tax=Piedraia hortae CBS 480.64 TaxID=1314780 RepID=A0A6A7BVR1_9PEZI|nr:hypothetical protein K470DRAFT_265739 [Piedraia hortae CBS 480.64]